MGRYDSLHKTIVYNFRLGDGGIGDCIKFFMFLLDACIKNGTRLYYKRNGTELEKYLKLKYEKMYIDEDGIRELGETEIVKPQMYYETIQYEYTIAAKDVFYFTEEVAVNCRYLFPADIGNYISVHVRLGDKFLETDKRYVMCKNDVRKFSEEDLYAVLNENRDKQIFFCCDNNSFKMKIKEKFANIIVTTCEIGHTSLSNTTKRQVLDSVTEFYILTNSERIYSTSLSGFSRLASKFNNIPFVSLSIFSPD